MKLVLCSFVLFFIHLLLISPFLIAQERGRTIRLPSPRHEGELSVEEAIYQRRSIRRYRDIPLSLEHVSQLLWASGGRTIDGVTGPTRAYPSAGGLYPLEIYLVAGKVENLEAGIYHYNWKDHSIRMTKSGDVRADLMRAALHQRMIVEAPISIVFMGDYEKVRRRYGRRGVERYIQMDVGGAGVNVSLQAHALGLGSVIIGAFHDHMVKEIMAVRELTPLYIIPVGKPR